VLCVAVGVALGSWHGICAARGRPEPVTGAVRAVTAPLAGLVSSVWNWFADQGRWVFRGRELDEENRDLRAQVAVLTEERNRLRESDAKLRRLEPQLGFARDGRRSKIAAAVRAIRPEPSFDTVVLGVGARRGVKRGAVVVVPEGVVGHVYDVGPTTSAVLLITDSSSSIGALVQRPESRAIGVCRGRGDGLLSMAYLSREADVRVGDQIVSSGLGGPAGVYPKGLVIGTVVRVDDDRAMSARIALVRPTVSVGSMEEVYVLP
jgi:rod shape-determining protein MreC